MKTGILSLVGNTPLVELNQFSKDFRFRLFAKLEAFNPGGSIKDRPALNILRTALGRGDIGLGSTIIESSSGNMGIGLAQACRYYGMRLICVVDPKTTAQNINILKAYGAEIDLVSEPDPATGEFLQARINRVQSLLNSIPDSFWPDQYSNIQNAIAHEQTMHEIVTELDGKVDYLFCSTSTCGTIRGCATYAQNRKLQTKVLAVDAKGSVLFGDKPAKRLIPGHGAAVVPKLLNRDLVDGVIHVSDLECVVGCRRLVRDEAILVGGSSGAVIMSIERMRDTIAADATCVAIFPDRGERYLDTIYSDVWVEQHFGDVFHLWQNPTGVEPWTMATC
ncbi:MAG TPA: 2,3-diaminopropionate biosynthesis protein SbnA [Blastocatellia bacterium]|nr:2,3-diaminopropionate biosynthesis protein SbnA [Blastocatellia bacterium]